MNGKELYKELKEYYEGVGRFIITFSAIENNIGMMITKIENKLEVNVGNQNLINNQRLSVLQKISKLDKLVEQTPKEVWRYYGFQNPFSSQQRDWKQRVNPRSQEGF